MYKQCNKENLSQLIEKFFWLDFDELDVMLAVLLGTLVGLLKEDRLPVL